jgi:hypothetical protein
MNTKEDKKIQWPKEAYNLFIRIAWEHWQKKNEGGINHGNTIRR